MVVMLGSGMAMETAGMLNGWTKGALNCMQTCVVPMFSGTTGDVSTVSTSSEGEEEERKRGKNEEKKRKQQKKRKSGKQEKEEE